MGAVAVVMGVLVACLAIPFAGLVGVAAKDVSKGMVNLPESLEAKDLSPSSRRPSTSSPRTPRTSTSSSRPRSRAW